MSCRQNESTETLQAAYNSQSVNLPTADEIHFQLLLIYCQIKKNPTIKGFALNQECPNFLIRGPHCHLEDWRWGSCVWPVLQGPCGYSPVSQSLSFSADLYIEGAIDSLAILLHNHASMNFAATSSVLLWSQVSSFLKSSSPQPSKATNHIPPFLCLHPLVCKPIF